MSMKYDVLLTFLKQLVYLMYRLKKFWCFFKEVLFLNLSFCQSQFLLAFFSISFCFFSVSKDTYLDSANET